jgi:hypothetical protein
MNRLSMFHETFLAHAVRISATGPGETLICQCKFEACGTCVDMVSLELIIAYTVFLSYTTVAGLLDATDLEVVECAFISDSCPAITVSGSNDLWLERTCFSRNGLVVDGDSSRTHTDVVDCCFRAGQGVPLWTNYQITGSSYGCVLCDESWVQPDLAACASFGDIRQTPWPTRSHHRTVPAPTAERTPEPPRTSTREFTTPLVRPHGRSRIVAIGWIGLLVAFDDF